MHVPKIKHNPNFKYDTFIIINNYPEIIIISANIINSNHLLQIHTLQKTKFVDYEFMNYIDFAMEQLMEINPLF